MNSAFFAKKEISSSELRNLSPARKLSSVGIAPTLASAVASEENHAASLSVKRANIGVFCRRVLRRGCSLTSSPPFKGP